MIRLLIAEDHALLRSGLKKIMASHGGIEVAGETAQGNEVLEKVRALPLDLLLLDLNMPGLSGPDLIRRVRIQCPALPILVLTMHNTAAIASRALKAGANGFITKDSEPEALLAAIEKVARGGKFIAPEVAEQMAFESTGHTGATAHHKLTNREMDVFRRLTCGTSLNDIAADMCISSKTVSTHKARLMEKLQASNTADLVLYAVEHQLLETGMGPGVRKT
jgi:DNA-binding NarL/FixJ family response regulator